MRGIDDARMAPPGPPEEGEAAAPDAACEESRRALDVAYRALGVRDRTQAELRRFLERRRVEPATIDAVVAELRRAGYVDDARYARLFAEDKRRIERWGRERIERDLRRRGVADELIRAALEGHARTSELELAAGLLAERFGALADDRDRDRAWRLLVRRGFEPELAYEAVRRHERTLRDAA